MKSSFYRSHGLRSAFTLPEVMLALSVVLIVLAGVMTSHLCGLRMFQLTRSKIVANQDARRVLSRMTDEIRGAKWVEVGIFTNNAFKTLADGKAQRGNAIQIYATATNSPFIRYYLNLTGQELVRVTNNTMEPLSIANSVTNYFVFSAEDMQGNVLTTNRNNRVIGLTLDFYQLQYPTVKIGPGQLYDFYQLSSKITRRTLE